MAFDHTISFIESAYANLKRKIAVNIMNDGGYMKGLPLDIQTELFAIVDKNGVHPISNNGLNKPVMAALFRDRIAPLEMELAAFEQKSKVLLKELILMDPWTKTDKQAEAFLEEILNLPWNKEMKEYYK
jgi:alpha-galactosidase